MLGSNVSPYETKLKAAQTSMAVCVGCICELLAQLSRHLRSGLVSVYGLK